MSFTEIVKAAMDLGVVPTLALLLVYAMYRQNKQLAEDRREMETKLLTTITQVLGDYQKLLSRQYMGQDRQGDPHA